MYRIKGCVLLETGGPLSGAVIQAFDKGLRREALLGRAITDESGRYQITYHSAGLREANNKQADLIVRSYDRADQEIAASPVMFNAQTLETVNLTVSGEKYRGPSEYQQLVDAVTPLLRDVGLSDLTEEDAAFLAGKTGSDSQQIASLVLAVQHAEKTNLAPEVFYGLLRSGSPTTLPALLAQGPEVQCSALQAAVRNNIIPPTLSVTGQSRPLLIRQCQV